jgi:hypothetical protein
MTALLGVNPLSNLSLLDLKIFLKNLAQANSFLTHGSDKTLLL